MTPIIIISFISLFTLGTSCPKGWTNFNDEKCYLYNDVNKNYAAAKLLCSKLNATLATIESPEEMLLLEGLGRIHSGLSGVHWAWIGATRSGKDSSFKWPDGSDLNYTRWRDRCPDSRVGEDCVLMTVFKERSSHWCNFNCENNKDHVICEKPWTKELSLLNDRDNSTTSSSTTTQESIEFVSYSVPKYETTNSPRQTTKTKPEIRRKSTSTDATPCPLGWEMFESKCYMLYGENITGDHARLLCNGYGARMVSVHSEHLQSFLTEFAFFQRGAKRAIWLGARRFDKGPKDFLWYDKSSFDYENWATQEPDNKDPGERCVAINDQNHIFGRWFDAPCHSLYNVVCVKNAKLILKVGSEFNTSSSKTSNEIDESSSTNSQGVSSKQIVTVVKGGHSHLVAFLSVFSLILILIVTGMGYLMMKMRKRVKNSDLYSSTLNFSNMAYSEQASSVIQEPVYDEPNYEVSNPGKERLFSRI